MPIREEIARMEQAMEAALGRRLAEEDLPAIQLLLQSSRDDLSQTLELGIGESPHVDSLV